MQNKDYFRQISDLKIHSFTEFIEEYGAAGYRRNYLINTGKTELSKEDSYKLEFYNAGCVRIVSLWLKAGCEEPPELIADLLISQMPEVYHQVDQDMYSAALNSPLFKAERN